MTNGEAARTEWLSLISDLLWSWQQSISWMLHSWQGILL